MDNDRLIPENWPARIAKMFRDYEVSTYSDLATFRIENLWAYPGVGEKAVELIEQRLREKGLSLAERTNGNGYRLFVDGLKSIAPLFTVGVYFVQCEQFVKIGSAICVRSRLSDLQVAIPFPLTVRRVIRCPDETSARILEQKLHHRFRTVLFRGEWYHNSPEIDAFLENSV